VVDRVEELVVDRKDELGLLLWIGYGDRFEEGALKILPAGSVYSEPGQMNHFARSGAEPVLVEISGFGPTDTRYVNSADAQKTPNR